MVCPVCIIDQQRIKLPWHLVDDHQWLADDAEAYYQAQIDVLLRATKETR